MVNEKLSMLAKIQSLQNAWKAAKSSGSTDPSEQLKKLRGPLRARYQSTDTAVLSARIAKFESKIETLQSLIRCLELIDNGDPEAINIAAVLLDLSIDD